MSAKDKILATVITVFVFSVFIVAAMATRYNVEAAGLIRSWLR